MIKILLWDLDGTLLNFLASEKNSLKAAFKKFGLGNCDDEKVARYSAINLKHWKMLERGEITKEQVKVMRFEEFFRTEGIDCVSPVDFWHVYEQGLPDTVEFIEDSYSIVKTLSADYKQYLVTNGTLSVQRKKLAKSGLNNIMDGAFISDEIGYEKPDKRFFDAVFSTLSPCIKNEIMIIGDSLTSDMKGGANAGIKTCWYNPDCKHNNSGLPLDYEINSLSEIYRILKED
ncbi:MAG: noncanonical pyrimidine nucleotidase, YjjG family [Ruminococcaceae bacterium]|nr:noncanonical pyrimidine nucleotidase, YjjG family [Oscillospiraceae bacterium]